MIYPHQAVPGTAYASNLSNASAYEYSDIGNTSCTGETPYMTAFDIVVKIGIDDSDGKNTTSGLWDNTYLYCLVTCSELSIGAGTNMTEKQIANYSGYAWYHYYMNNGGAGYTVSEGESFNVTGIKLYVNRIV
jgi:hypothetical protein